HTQRMDPPRKSPRHVLRADRLLQLRKTRHRAPALPPDRRRQRFRIFLARSIGKRDVKPAVAFTYRASKKDAESLAAAIRRKRRRAVASFAELEQAISAQDVARAFPRGVHPLGV